MKYLNDFGRFYSKISAVIDEEKDIQPTAKAQVLFSISAKLVIDFMKTLPEDQKSVLAASIAVDVNEFIASMITDGGLKVDIMSVPDIKSTDKKDMN